MSRNKHALLINPWITDFAAYDFWLRPLGLLMVGAALRGAGFEVTLIDCLDRAHPSLKGAGMRERGDGTGKYLKTEIPKPGILEFAPRKYGRYGIPIEAFKDDLDRAGGPDVVMITSHMTYWYEGVFEAIRIARARFPGAPVVLGGRYATLCPEHAREKSGADYIFEGQFDGRAGVLIEKLTGIRPEIPGEYSQFPLPAHDLCCDSSVAAVAFSRGCPFRCTYCVSHVLCPRFEQRTAESAIEEVRLLAERGVRHIAFYDDALLVNAGKLLVPVLRFVIERGYRLNFFTPNAIHAALITPELADLMARAGFSQLRLGFESDDPVFQRETGGKVTSEQFERAVKNLLKAGFKGSDISAYIICGHPDQTEESIRAAMRAAAGLGVEPVFVEYSPIPGSADFRKAAAFRHPPDADPLLHNSSIVMYQHPNIPPEGFARLKTECIELRAGIRNVR